MNNFFTFLFKVLFEKFLKIIDLEYSKKKLTIFKTIYIYTQNCLNNIMENQEAAPSTNINDKKNNDQKKNEKNDDELPNKNEIIIEEPKEKSEDKKEEPKEIKYEKEAKIENQIEDIPGKNEIIIEKPEIKTKKDEEKEKKPPKKKKRIEMDPFEKFMDSVPKELNQFEFDFYGDTLIPDCIYFRDERKYYVYFNLEKLKNKLEEKWQDIFKNYPTNLADFRQPLAVYKLKSQKKIYEEETGFFATLPIKIKCLINRESFNQEVRERAKALAMLLSQIDHREKQSYTTIALIDSKTLIIDFYSYMIFDTINNEIKEINIKAKNDKEKRESLKIVSEKLETLYNNIDDNYGDSEKGILKSYLANEISQKLRLIENDAPEDDSEEYEQMKKIRNKVNNIIQQNIEREIDKSFFFNDDTFKFKIIKNTKEKKLVLLNSVFMKQFYDHLVQIFSDLRDQLLQFDENDNEIKPEKKIDFIRRHMIKIKDLQQLNANIKKEINKTNSDMAKLGIDMTKSGFEILNNLKLKKFSEISEKGKNVVDNYQKIVDYAIDKELLNKSLEIINYRKEETIKLIKEFDLKEKLYFIEDKRFNSKAFNGILITKEINLNNTLMDSYSVDLF